MKILDAGKRQYKVELHCHSTFSDGKFTPQEIKKLYKQNGFDAVAFTDHDVLVRHNELTDDTFVALNGAEMQIPAPGKNGKRYIHMNFIAETPDVDALPYYDPMYAGFCKNEAALKQQKCGDESGFRDPSPEGLNRIIRAGNRNGFLVFLNHPKWSVLTDLDMIPLEGLFGVEVHNSAYPIPGADTDTPYQNMLLMGKRLNCLATNDFHNTRYPWALSGAVYVQAEELSYAALIRALKQGTFYSSNGPQITEIEIDGDRLHIVCSPAKSVAVENADPLGHYLYDEDGNITEANFQLGATDRNWFRVVVTDVRGRKAYSNAVFSYPSMNLAAEYPDGLDRLLLCPREENLTAEDAGAQARICLVSEFAADQIREGIRLAEEHCCGEITMILSTTDSIAFDIFYYAGREILDAKQAAQIALLKKSLQELETWLQEKSVKLRLCAMRPLPHNPQIYDYRNSYICRINDVLRDFCSRNRVEYIDAYNPMAGKDGILLSKYEDAADRQQCYRKLLIEDI